MKNMKQKLQNYQISRTRKLGDGYNRSTKNYLLTLTYTLDSHNVLMADEVVLPVPNRVRCL